MKKQSRFLAAMLAALALSMPAHAAISFEGKVVSSESVAVLAPFGGLVDSVGLRVGDPIKLGDSVANISTTKVYATSDGTISGVFAREGDATDGVVERYGAVVYIEPTNRYKSPRRPKRRTTAVIRSISTSAKRFMFPVPRMARIPEPRS